MSRWPTVGQDEWRPMHEPCGRARAEQTVAKAEQPLEDFIKLIVESRGDVTWDRRCRTVEPMTWAAFASQFAEHICATASATLAQVRSRAEGAERSRKVERRVVAWAGALRGAVSRKICRWRAGERDTVMEGALMRRRAR